MPDRVFRDRRDAGRALARLLERYRDRGDVVVLALPRGGVPVAFEVATALGAPLDVFLVRKLGVPGHEELAMGAIASGGVVVMNDDIVRGLGIRPEVVQRIAEARELLRRERTYRDERPPLDIAGKVVILVDDGLATGSSMLAAVNALRKLHPAQIIIAVPAAPESTCRELSALVDDVVCATTPSPFFAVGESYWDFTQTTDQEVTTYSGTVTAADDWGGPAERKNVRPALPGSFEALFHEVGKESFAVPFRSTSRSEALRAARLERAIGVIYRPSTERESHHFRARLAEQFDMVIHIDDTRAVEPLERTARWDRGEVPETFPHAV